MNIQFRFLKRDATQIIDLFSLKTLLDTFAVHSGRFQNKFGHKRRIIAILGSGKFLSLFNASVGNLDVAYSLHKAGYAICFATSFSIPLHFFFII